MISLTSVLNFAWTIGLSVWRFVRMIPFAISTVMKNLSSAQCHVLVKVIAHRVVKVVVRHFANVEILSLVQSL